MEDLDFEIVVCVFSSGHVWKQMKCIKWHASARRWRL